MEQLDLLDFYKKMVVSLKEILQTLMQMVVWDILTNLENLNLLMIIQILIYKIKDK